MNQFDFSRRSPMSYRRTLRDIPKPLRRRWLALRLQFTAPRVAISSAWFPEDACHDVKH